MRLRVLPDRFAIARFEPDAALPPAVQGGGFWSATRTRDELSVVCEEARVPDGIRTEPGWRAIAVAGPLDFSLVGVMAALASALAAAGVSLFAISTFDTDYLLVREHDLPTALEALRAAGHETG